MAIANNRLECTENHKNPYLNVHDLLVHIGVG